MRTMKPEPGGRIESTISRSRRRSLSEPMRREMPTWSTVGMNTRWRPGSEMYRVVRAPLVLIGSLVTWTTISCPSFSRSSMRAPPPARARRRLRRRRRPSSRLDSARKQALEVVGRAAHVRDVQVGALLEADVDERGLHPGEHALDPALVDVAGDAALALALDVELAQVPVLNERDPGLRPVGVDDEQAARRHPKRGLSSKICWFAAPSRRAAAQARWRDPTGSRGDCQAQADVNVRVHHGTSRDARGPS